MFTLFRPEHSGKKMARGEDGAGPAQLSAAGGDDHDAAPRARG